MLFAFQSSHLSVASQSSGTDRSVCFDKNPSIQISILPFKLHPEKHDIFHYWYDSLIQISPNMRSFYKNCTVLYFFTLSESQNFSIRSQIRILIIILIFSFEFMCDITKIIDRNQRYISKIFQNQKSMRTYNIGTHHHSRTQHCLLET